MPAGRFSCGEKEERRVEMPLIINVVLTREETIQNFMLKGY